MINLSGIRQHRLGFAAIAIGAFLYFSGAGNPCSAQNDPIAAAARRLADSQAERSPAASQPVEETTAKLDAPANDALTTEADPLDTNVTIDTPVDLDASDPAGPRVPLSAEKYYNLCVVIPAAIAILLAIIFRQVVPALVLGVVVGAYMFLPCLPNSSPYVQGNSVIGGFRLATEYYMLGAIHQHGGEEYAHLKIIVFTLVIGFMVGVIGRNGGTEGMVRLVAGDTNSRRRGAVTAWGAGLVVFFDDYANSMIVGPTMRSVFDRLKLSRAKLAYIVDSTAAPVASIALIGTWVGMEVGYIDQGLQAVAANGPALLDANGNVLTGMSAFVYSIPYRFYPILALFLVFLVAVTGRDFGPMKREERKALSQTDSDTPPTDADTDTNKTKALPRWWLGFFPVVGLVLGTVGVLITTGWYSEKTIALVNAMDNTGQSVWAQKAWWVQAGDVLQNADSYLSIFHGAIIAAIVAVLLTMIVRACPLRDMIESGLEGMTTMFSAIVVLVLAWALSQVLQDLRLGQVVSAHLKDAGFALQWFPLAVFVASAVVSFATGTSWGTMGILCPMTITVGAHLAVGVDPAESVNLIYAAIGSVLAGAVFGDHCSPISDTTVLSSIASGCKHEVHVWTQIPYALIAGIAAMGLGDVLCSVYKQPWYVGLGAGALFLVLWIFIVGRRAEPNFELADA